MNLRPLILMLLCATGALADTVGQSSVIGDRLVLSTNVPAGTGLKTSLVGYWGNNLDEVAFWKGRSLSTGG